MKTNLNELVQMRLNAKVDPPRMGKFYVGADGKGRLSVGTGGIVTNVKIGDNAMNLAGDHIEPGVSLTGFDDGQTRALCTLACIGNRVRVIGQPYQGYVIGTHGGVNHTIVHFPQEAIDQLTGLETFIIDSFGQGLKTLDYPDIHWMNLDPWLLDHLDLVEKKDHLSIGVAHVIGAHLLGAGVGSSTLMEGDVDIQTQDREELHRLGLMNLRLGDIVAFEDVDCRYGPHYQKGAVSIGVVIHSDSFSSGHGPGVTIFATACQGLSAHRSQQSNLSLWLL